MDTGDSAAVNSRRPPPPTVHTFWSLPCFTSLCNYSLEHKDSASAADEDSNRASHTHTPVCTLEYVCARKMKAEPRIWLWSSSCLRGGRGQPLMYLSVFVASQPLLCRLCGPDCCLRAHALKDDQLRPGLCPLDANSTVLPLPLWSLEAFWTLLNVPEEARSLCLRTTGSEQINRPLFPSRFQPLFLRKKGQRGMQEITGKGAAYLERGSQTRADVCLFRSKGSSYQGTRLTERLITDSGSLLPNCPSVTAHYNSSHLKSVSVFCLLKRLVNEVTKMNGC